MLTDLAELLRPSVEALGYEFWGLGFSGSGKKRSVLRVYIDHENGISVDDCEVVSRQLSRLLDVEDPIHGEYVLEVSSPGLERPLFYPQQYVHYCGELIALRTHMPVAGQRNFKGVLKQVLTDKIVMVEHDKEVNIEFSNIQKAHLVVPWNNIKE